MDNNQNYPITLLEKEKEWLEQQLQTVKDAIKTLKNGAQSVAIESVDDNTASLDENLVHNSSSTTIKRKYKHKLSRFEADEIKQKIKDYLRSIPNQQILLADLRKMFSGDKRGQMSEASFYGFMDDMEAKRVIRKTGERMDRMVHVN